MTMRVAWLLAVAAFAVPCVALATPSNNDAFSLGKPTAVGRLSGRAFAANGNEVVSMGGGGSGYILGDESTVDAYQVSTDSWTSSAPRAS